MMNSPLGLFLLIMLTSIPLKANNAAQQRGDLHQQLK